MVPMDEQTLDSDALQGMVDPALVEALQVPLGKLTKDVEILLFVAPGCPSCPHQLRTTAALALAGCATTPPPKPAAAPAAAAEAPIQQPPLVIPADLPAPPVTREKLDNGLRVRRGNLVSGMKRRLSDSSSVYLEERYQDGGSLTGEKCQQGLRVAGRMLDLVPDDVLAQLKGA